MTTTVASALAMRQHPDLTFKYNLQHGRHGWLRLTPAYSVKVVERILAEFGAGASNVFDPFSGTGTTALCAAYRGLQAAAIDINPFLVWLGRTKCMRYDEQHKQNLLLAATRIAALLRERKGRHTSLPPLANIDRWWNPAELEFLSELHGALADSAEGPARELLKVVFCRTMISLSNAAFNHQSMSFRDRAASEQLDLGLDNPARRFVDQFLADLWTVANAATDNPRGTVRIERCDARSLATLPSCQDSFDLLITSPPYPNRMSYIRELRPYMYWLGFLENANEAGELDWESIGGTWGIATSRLLTWKPTDAFIPEYLPPIVERIRASHAKNGPLMAQYVHKYFDDMFLHFVAAASIVRRGGTAHYIVGNSTFYGHIVPAERVYCDQLLKAGFSRAEAKPIRKRNSKKDLVEFHVIAER